MGRPKRESSTSTNSAGPGSSDAESPDKRQRAKKTSYSLDAEVENALMEWIKENQILWNSKLIHFKRTDMKEALWTEKGQQLGKTADYLRGWWRSIKDNFTRLDKKMTGDKTKELTEREEWILKTCSFLWPLVRHKPQPLRNVTEDHAGQGGDILAQAAQAGIADKEECPYTLGTITIKKGKKRKHQDNVPTLQTLENNLCKCGHLPKQLAEPVPLNRRAAFANFVRDSLLTMSKPKYKVAKTSIWDTLHKLDMFDDSSSDDDGDKPAAPALFLAQHQAQLCTPPP